MDIFNILDMIGGLCLFLFGMNLMGQALERRAGGKLHSFLSKMTTNKMAGFLTGCGVTAVIQSSSATTVMVVGFVNSGIMTLHQAVNVIMGANVGTTITGWILSLGGISGDSFWVRLLKPASFTPVLAFIGIIYYMFLKKEKKKDTGMILLGFATLMFGMEAMTNAVSGLGDNPAFRELFVMFQNPFLGLLAGAALTAVIQSSSASVGILQALAATGAVSYGAAIPIVMGDAIGTCVTAMLSSVGAKRDAKRAAVVHLSFNIIGAIFWLVVYSVVRAVFDPAEMIFGILLYAVPVYLLIDLLIHIISGKKKVKAFFVQLLISLLIFAELCFLCFILSLMSPGCMIGVKSPDNSSSFVIKEYKKTDSVYLSVIDRKSSVKQSNSAPSKRAIESCEISWVDNENFNFIISDSKRGGVYYSFSSPDKLTEISKEEYESQNYISVKNISNKK